MLKGKKILLGVTGSIAAYKAAFLIRQLIKQDAEVKVVMTELAKEFITPLTLATLAKNPVLVDFFNPENGDWNSHVDLGIWADAYVIAPATANTIAKMANGIADNLLLTTYLSARCPVFIAPAMDLDMFQHIATRENIDILKKRGVTIIEPSTGELASGLEGKGRMEDSEAIVAELNKSFRIKKKNKLSGKTVLITAGPTYEKIDPVRFIGNFSSGKMGYALAEEAALNEAEVILVSGPVIGNISHKNIKIISVTSADEMYTVCNKYFKSADIAILAAAVADYKPKEIQNTKLKKKEQNITLELVSTVDIAKSLGSVKRKDQVLVGFALETDNAIENARQKLIKKNFDLIVVNSLEDPGAGFQFDTNKITILDKHNNTFNFELKSKKKVAEDIIDKVIEFTT